MIAWFNSLTLIQRVFAVIAIPSTVILLLQTILLIFGFGDDDADSDGVPDDIGDDGLALFSIRGIVAMLCVGGWSGIVLSEAGLNNIVVVILAAVIGIAALVGMAMLIKLLLKLQSNGNIQLSNAVGKVGQVYVPIPADSKGTGKINITIQEKYSELSAMTTETTDIKTGEMVRVVATDEVGILMVERLKNQSTNSK